MQSIDTLQKCIIFPSQLCIRPPVYFSIHNDDTSVIRVHFVFIYLGYIFQLYNAENKVARQKPSSLIHLYNCLHFFTPEQLFRFST